jgi:protein-tyrosine phosphatase
MAARPVRICFVCLGNICRSPTAEAVMAHLVDAAGAEDRVTVGSAGTGGWHVGEGADTRAVAEAGRRGIAMHHRARRFVADDFARFDLVVAMDADNARDLRAVAPGPDDVAKVRMLLDFDAASVPGSSVPDPYYGGPEGFALVFDLVERACRGLLAHVTT